MLHRFASPRPNDQTLTGPGRPNDQTLFGKHSNFYEQCLNIWPRHRTFLDKQNERNV